MNTYLFPRRCLVLLCEILVQQRKLTRNFQGCKCGCLRDPVSGSRQLPGVVHQFVEFIHRHKFPLGKSAIPTGLGKRTLRSFPALKCRAIFVPSLAGLKQNLEHPRPGTYVPGYELALRRNERRLNADPDSYALIPTPSSLRPKPYALSPRLSPLPPPGVR